MILVGICTCISSGGFAIFNAKVYPVVCNIKFRFLQFCYSLVQISNFGTKLDEILFLNATSDVNEIGVYIDIFVFKGFELCFIPTRSIAQ